jgi:multidrug efflux system membrane fusion protein
MKRGRLLLVLLVLAAAGAAGWYGLIHRPARTTQVARGGQRPRPGSAEGDPIPVLAAAAITQDVPVYLDALGTVQAFYTVSVKAMIDGPLASVEFKEGQDVKTGDVLARIDPRPYQAALDQALGKKAQDEANLANARVDLARYQKLVATQYTSGQTADTQKSTVAQLVAQIQQDQAQIDTARTNLSYTTIQSPIDGRTGIRQVDPGNIVHAADTTPLVVITQLQPISVVFNLPQQTLPMVAAAMAQGAPQVLALPQGVANDGNTVLDRGRVAVLDNTVDQSTGTIKLKATFPNPKLLLWPGGFVNVRLLVETQHGVVTVPPVAVQRGPAGAYVYVVQSNNTVERRPIQVGHQDEDVAVVTAGLRPGDRVVTDGASRLMDGSRISVQDSTAPAVQTAPQAEGRQRASAAP